MSSSYSTIFMVITVYAGIQNMKTKTINLEFLQCKHLTSDLLKQSDQFNICPRYRGVQSQIDNNTDRTLEVFFLRFKGFSLRITLRQKRKEVTRMLQLCIETRNFFWLLLQLVIMNEITLNLEKTTISVLSVLLLIQASNKHYCIDLESNKTTYIQTFDLRLD